MDDTCSVVCSEACTLLASCDPESAQVIIADAPYGMAYESNGKHAARLSEAMFQIRPFLEEAERVLAVGGALYLFARWDVYPVWAQAIPSGLKLSNLIVWGKNNWPSVDNGNFAQQHEFILFLTKGPHVRRGKRWSNIWALPRVPAKQLRVPSEKPTALIRRAIEASSDPGQLVIDPFAGSGTTGEAARACGRRTLLGDLDPAMVRLMCERLSLPVPDIVHGLPRLPLCPVMRQEAPLPALWGLHPEDLGVALDRFKLHVDDPDVEPSPVFDLAMLLGRDELV